MKNLLECNRTLALGFLFTTLALIISIIGMLINHFELMIMSTYLAGFGFGLFIAERLS